MPAENPLFGALTQAEVGFREVSSAYPMIPIIWKHFMSAVETSGILDTEDTGFSHLFTPHTPEKRDQGESLFYPTQMAMVEDLGEQGQIQPLTAGLVTNYIQQMLSGELRNSNERRRFVQGYQKDDESRLTADDK